MNHQYLYAPQIEAGNILLLELADILDIVDAEHAARGALPFTMRMELYPCGAPACAWGHYAVSTPARKEKFVNTADYAQPRCNYNDASAEFFLSTEEWRELFERDGCNNAATGKDAALYIRQFVDRRRTNDSLSGQEYTHGYVPGSAS